MAAVIAKYNFFAEHAGLRRVAVQEPAKATLRVADVFSDMGFNLQLLGSEKYLQRKLEGLTTRQLSVLKSVLVKTNIQELLRGFQVLVTCHMADQQTTKLGLKMLISRK
jgi:hypothetical protein